MVNRKKNCKTNGLLSLYEKDRNNFFSQCITMYCFAILFFIYNAIYIIQPTYSNITILEKKKIHY